MRENKFRVWGDDFEEMFHKVGIIDGSLFISFDQKGYDEVGDYKNFRIMQYTGLKDKNGTEIYEGDIVKYITRKPMLPETYAVRDMTDFQHMRILEKLINSSISDVKVIGNIYENPELLENGR